MKRLLAAWCVFLLLFAAFAASAQTKPLVLPVGTNEPAVDGVTGTSEYPVGAEIGKMKVRLSRTSDTVYASFSAETTGWVAVGFGSLKMDGALMFIAFATADGAAQLKIQKGKGRTHGDVESDALIKFAVKEQGGVTTLELALKAASLIGGGATELPMVFAMGGADSFTSPHRARGSQQVKLE